ncbi:spermidine synthase [Microbacterium sp. G2-8]|uniref:spermidine synthase n=1 Tax=Microbacterium sp. G2-8 TaxID=2842454 RepID=UPI001C8ACFF2|nr:fused MFS/spermidine synthase [Microbacterium sp. G2-8]
MGRQRRKDTDFPQARLASGANAEIRPSEFGSGSEVIIDGTPQSHVDLADPAYLAFEYVARMGAVIDQLPDGPVTAVHLGAGGLTLPRYIAHTRPGSRQQVVELEQPLVDLVREHLPLPRDAQIRVRFGDARAGLARLPASLRGTVDLLVSDVYSGAQTPAHLTTTSFYREAAALLSPRGILLVNVADGSGLAFARRQAATIREVLPHVAILAEVQVLKGRRFGNLVFAASAEPLPTDWLPRLMAAGPHPAKVAEGREVDTFIAGALPVADDDATDSPRPSSSLFS